MKTDLLSKTLEDAARRAIAYRHDLIHRHVAPPAEATARLAELDAPLPESPVPASEILRQLDELVAPATMATAGPRCFGFVIGGSLPAAVGASWLATAWDQNCALYRVTPGTAHIERVALGWLLEILGLPADAGGGFVTGASVANFCAMAAARHVLLKRARWNVEADGLFGAPPITVIVGAEAHRTLFKGLGLLGLGRERVLRVPVDGQGRMRADRFPECSGPTLVCLQAGNVNTGAFDPFVDVIEEAHRCGAWVHVDGAFGLWAAAVPERRHLVDGIERADSWGTDAHKWLNVPYDSGLVFVRDADALSSAMAVTAAYLPSATTFRNPSDFTPEFSRRARGVEVWAALRSLGRRGLAERLERSCRQARRFADGLREAGYRVLNDVVLNQVLVQFGDEETTRRVITAIQDEGTCWCGETTWQDHYAMRISVSSLLTADEDVEASLAAMLLAASKIRQGNRDR
jgi:glutamate/tyrosine decarboxylase-like PLP-dependent enzyme